MIVLQNARLIDPEALTETLGTLVIADGKITEILTQPVDKAEAFPTGKVIDCGGKCLAPGIVDIGVKVGEPGERHKESFRSAGLAAAAGGVTTIIARPDTTPAIDD
ncbi:MAG: dihydroorotase, partial [Albidovulum sp.]